MLAQTTFVWTTAHLIIVLSMSVPIIAIIGGMWYALERMRSENELKRSMVERGMSVDEIERVIKMKGK